MPEKSDFEVGQQRIDEAAEELVHGDPRSKRKKVLELRKLCGRHHTVPTSYRLEGVVKEGERPQHISQVTEIWKGRYNGEAVALKVLRMPRDDPRAEKTRARFCKEVVLVKQLEHENVLPFYGVLTTVSDFCLVFPWYENGSIMDYLKKVPDANRFGLLSDAARGLRFLHKIHLVHGALKPSHILIDNNGAARLATAGRSSIVATPGTSVAGHVQSAGGVDNNGQYTAPEIQWPDESCTTDDTLITKESDVYGMGMVAYEVLTGNTPYSKCNITTVLFKIQAGEMPQRPSDGIADPVWEFLKRCWNRDPTARPSTAQVYDAFSQPLSIPQLMRTLEGRSVTEELPGKLRLEVQSIKVSLNKPKQQQFSVKFKYGDKDHTTSPTKKAGAGDEHTWNGPETWLIETNQRHRGQLVSLEVLRKTSVGKIKVCATGKFTLSNNLNKHIHVKLGAPSSTGPATLKTVLTEAL